MSRYVVDTEHVSLYQRSSPLVFDRIRTIRAINLNITAVTVEEMTEGWLSQIRKTSESRQAQKLTLTYGQLC
jgi:tRNA(fMet)-specific endonuclease VapC